jgi:uncharacterized protein (DUF2267 family)
MNQDRFIDEVMRRTGFQQPAMASLAIDATLEVLSQRLSGPTARELLRQLPPGIGQALMRGPHGGNFDRDELYRRVSRREGVRLGFAVEHSQVVCQVIAESLGEPARDRLREELPNDIAELIAPRAELPPPPARPRRA